jgi:hypothetical protein
MISGFEKTTKNSNNYKLKGLLQREKSQIYKKLLIDRMNRKKIKFYERNQNFALCESYGLGL